jgi:L-amino acid N-acyltransferase YncA
MNFFIATMRTEDWPSVREIYGEGIAMGNATFETELPDWEKWDRNHRADCRFVARDSQKEKNDSSAPVLGWAALSPTSTRRVYAGVAEVSVYVASAARGRGVGKVLLQSLIDESEDRGIWTLQAGIFPENIASVRLHKSLRFREIGVRQRIGKMGNVWRDVLLLERRSATAGV